MVEMARHFAVDADIVSVDSYGNGHINDTYLVTTTGGRYIMQRINDAIFSDVDGLMRNVAAVTDYLAARDDNPRHVLRPVRTVDGKLYCLVDGGFWRMYNFIENSICLEAAQNADDFRMSAEAFGGFQRQLADFPADTLTETIVRFHDTADRYRIFREAINADPLGRAREVKREIEFAMERQEEAGSMVAMLANGELPLRVTHNDTKLNNVLLDLATRKPLCVIDLDTVMPGLAGNDFGDSIRFGASTAAEDERDLDNVHLSMELYEAYSQGFLAACGGSLTANELATLPLSAKLMTLECGVRFLTDYILGDIYFKIRRSGHNLDRCRTQFKLVYEMEKQWGEMRRVIDALI